MKLTRPAILVALCTCNQAVVAEEPALPAGLEGAAAVKTTAGGNATSGDIEFSGFWEIRGGVRTQSDDQERQTSLLETLAQFRIDRPGDRVSLKLTTDLVYDDVASSRNIDLESGEGWLDLREASILVRPVGFLDIKAGRQILTWGTGDLLFINDLFPKDWKSFFLGRDVEYLKAPSDAIKLALFTEAGNIDLVYTPRFDADRYIDGTRISYFDPLTGGLTGSNNPLRTLQPNNSFSDDEIAARIYHNVSGWELAAYGYAGFWKSPAGSDPVSGKARFPELNVLGLSARGTVGPGIGTMELGYYDSSEDEHGSDPLVRNSELRFLLGYEQEIARETTLGLQYYLEQIQDYNRYQATLPAGFPVRDQNRHLWTVRLTRMSLHQDLRLTLFAFYSPSDSDGYLRAGLNYRMNDQWTTFAGLNLFFGDEDHTFFGQFEKNSNTYIGIRYGFSN